MALGAQPMTASNIPPLSVWPCGTPWRVQGGPGSHRSGPITSPLPGDGAPRGLCLRPGAKVSGSQTDLLTPMVQRAGRERALVGLSITGGLGRRPRTGSASPYSRYCMSNICICIALMLGCMFLFDKRTWFRSERRNRTFICMYAYV